MCDQLDCLQKYSTLSQTTCRQYLHILKRLQKHVDKSYRQISIDEISQFIASLPGSIKPQAFAAIKLLYGKILWSQMGEKFQKRWDEIANISAKQRHRLPENAIFTREEIYHKVHESPIATRCLAWCIFYGMRMTEALNLSVHHVNVSVITLPGRQWQIPEKVAQDMSFLRQQAVYTKKRIFPLTRAAYMRRLQKLGLNVRQLRTAGIADAFKTEQDPYVVWPQFGIFDAQQQIKYWKIYV